MLQQGSIHTGHVSAQMKLHAAHHFRAGALPTASRPVRGPKRAPEGGSAAFGTEKCRIASSRGKGSVETLDFSSGTPQSGREMSAQKQAPKPYPVAGASSAGPSLTLRHPPPDGGHSHLAAVRKHFDSQQFEF